MWCRQRSSPRTLGWKPSGGAAAAVAKSTAARVRADAMATGRTTYALRVLDLTDGIAIAYWLLLLVGSAIF